MKKYDNSGFAFPDYQLGLSDTAAGIKRCTTESG